MKSGGGEAGIDVLNIEGLPRATGLSLRGSLRQGIVVLDTVGVRLSDGYGMVRGHARIDLGQFRNPGGRQPSYRAAVRVDGLAMGRFLGRPDLPGRRVVADRTRRRGISSGFCTGQRGP